MDISANASPSTNFSSGNLEEEEKNLKVSSFEDFYSYPAPWEEEDQEEEISNLEEEKISERAPNLEEEDYAKGRNRKFMTSLAPNDVVSLSKETSSQNDVVSLPRVTT